MITKCPCCSKKVDDAKTLFLDRYHIVVDDSIPNDEIHIQNKEGVTIAKIINVDPDKDYNFSFSITNE